MNGTIVNGAAVPPQPSTKDFLPIGLKSAPAGQVCRPLLASGAFPLIINAYKGDLLEEQQRQAELSSEEPDPGFISNHINRRGATHYKIGWDGNIIRLPDLAKPEPVQLAAVRMYEQDVVVNRRWTHTEQVGGGVRGSISGLSTQAQNRMVFTARNLRGLKVMLTLTYPGEYPNNGRVVKRHWDNMRRWLVRRGVAGFWFLEFQKRGAPHYHIFLTGRVNKKEVRAAWYKIVGSGDERHLRAGTKIEKLRLPHAAASYAAKYAGKKEQKQPPADYLEVGRFWGLFGGLKVEEITHTAGELSGEPGLAARVRALKKLYSQFRRARGLKMPKPDNGNRRLTLYGLASWANLDVLRLAHPEMGIT